MNLPPLKMRYTPNFSSRNGQAVRLIVLHDTEGGYQGAVSWLCNPNADASAHIVLREDGGEATQLVAYGDKAWACAGYNSVSENIELAGYAGRFSYAQLRSAARIVAFRLRKRGLPCKLVGPNGRGYTYHSLLGAVGGGHHDPAFTKAQAAYFRMRVQFEYLRGGFRKTWGRESSNV